MSVKITILKNGQHLISDMKELVAENQDDIQAYMLQNPHTYEINENRFLTEEEKKDGDFGINVTLVPWIILSKDKQVVLPTDIVLTVVEPIESVKKMYIDKREVFKMEELNG